MKITMTPTDTLTQVGGVPVRLWRGETDKGIACVVFVSLVGISEGGDQKAFEAELSKWPVGEYQPTVSLAEMEALLRKPV